MMRISPVVAMAMALAAPLPAAAAGGWVTDCTEDGSRCTAMLALADAASGKPVASLGMQVGKGGAEPAMVAILPLGIEIRPGVRAVVAGQGFEAPVEACFPDGCRAVAPIPREALDLWLDGTAASLQFFPYGADRPVAVEAPLAGLRMALQRMLDAQP